MNSIKINKFFRFLFIFAYFCILCGTFFSKVTFMQPFLPILKYASITILSILILMKLDRQYLKNIIMFFILIVISFISAYISDNMDVLFLVLLIFAISDMSLEEIIKIDLKLRIIIIAFVMSCFFLGLTNDYALYRDGIMRYSFGFSHPNVFGNVILMLGLDIIYLNRKKINIKYTIMLILMFLAVSYFSDSRSSALILIIGLLLYILVRKQWFINILKNTLVKKIITYSFIIFTLITFSIVYLYDTRNQIGLYLNNLFSNRIYFISDFLSSYKINLFGNKLYLVSTEQSKLINTTSRILDNSFIKIILNYGIFIYIFFAYGYCKSIAKCYIRKNYMLICLLFMIIIYGFMETYLFRITYNPFLFIFASLFFINKKEVTPSESN